MGKYDEMLRRSEAVEDARRSLQVHNKDLRICIETSDAHEGKVRGMVDDRGRIWLTLEKHLVGAERCPCMPLGRSDAIALRDWLIWLELGEGE